MTGYGKSVVTYKGKKINVEIKSLNSKTLDLSTRIAPLYREKEMEIRQAITAQVVRGKVDFAIWIEKDAAADAAPINAALTENYYNQIKAIARNSGIPEPQDWFATLLRMPDVLTRTETEVLDEEEWHAVRQAVDDAIGSLVSFRTQEGAALERKFREKVDNIEALLAKIEPYEKSRVEKIRVRIVEGLKAIPDVEYDKNRLEQELIYYIEKLDISEEKQRLANHLKYFRETMDEAAGSLLADEKRLLMAQTAVSGIPGVTATDYEFHLPRPSYMWNTLQSLSRDFPERDFTLLIGADNWAVFHRWYRADDIIAHYPIAIYPRTGYPIDTASLPPNVKLIDTGLYDISSTQVRELIARGGDITGLVPDSVVPLATQFYSK